MLFNIKECGLVFLRLFAKMVRGVANTPYNIKEAGGFISPF
jgi:hypothetical protein